jgi:hypothetical protein
MNKLKDVAKSLELKRIQLDNEKSTQNLINEIKLQNDSLERVIELLNEVRESIDSQQYPQPLSDVSVKNLEEIKIPELKSVQIEKPTWLKLKQFSLSELIDSIGDLFNGLLNREFKVDLEQYRIAKNAISVRLSNGREFIESFNAGIASGISSIEFPSWLAREETQKEISKKLDDFYLNDVEEHSTNENIEYIGKENKDGDWLVIKIEELIKPEFRYATISNNQSIDNYTDAFTNRETLTYGIYSEAF